MSQGFSSKRVAFAGNGMTKVFVNGTRTATTGSGTITVDGIPSGVKKVYITFDKVSQSASATWNLTIGDAGGLEVTGYESVGCYLSDGGGAAPVSNTSNSLVSFRCHPTIGGAAASYSGTVTLTLQDAATNTWAFNWLGSDYPNGRMVMGAGAKSLSGELTQFSIAVHTGTFDAGNINVTYDNPDPTVVAETRSGLVVQTVRTSDGEYSSLSGGTVIGLDNTIPQSGEGHEVMTASITPNDAANRLHIRTILNFSTGTTAYHIGALFQDSVADALNATSHYQLSGTTGQITIDHWMDAGTTDSTTFKARLGYNIAATVYFNGQSAARLFGGVNISSITITEYKA